MQNDLPKIPKRRDGKGYDSLKLEQRNNGVSTNVGVSIAHPSAADNEINSDHLVGVLKTLK